MAKHNERILNVTVEQYATFEATGVLECAHFEWMPHNVIISVLHPNRCQSLPVTKTEYPVPTRMRITA